jgi:predicted GTPase
MTKIASEDKIRIGLSFEYPNRRELQSALDEYKKTALNICLIGRPGVGKSSFINAIRGIDCKHPNAASIDINEHTLKSTPYEVTNNKHVRYWDVPGEFRPLPG